MLCITASYALHVYGPELCFPDSGKLPEVAARFVSGCHRRVPPDVLPRNPKNPNIGSNELKSSVAQTVTMLVFNDVWARVQKERLV